MAASSPLQLASCKGSCAIASSTWNRPGGPGWAAGEGGCALRIVPATGYILGRGGLRRLNSCKLPLKSAAGILGTGQLLTASSAKAASQTYELSLEEAASVQVGEADTSVDQIIASQDSLKDVADASQLSLDDVVDDAKERAADVVGGAQELAADVMDDAKERVEDVLEGTRNLFEGSGEKAGGAIQDFQSGFGDWVDSLSKPQGGEALQDPAEGAQDKAEDAGDALQDLVEGTQDRLESVQDAFKAFADKLTSKSAESITDASEPALNAGEPSAPSIENLPEELSAPTPPSVPDSAQTMLESVDKVSPSVVEEAAPSAIEGVQGSAPVAAEEGGQAITGALSSFQESASDSVTAAQESVSDAVDSAGAALGAGKAAVDDVLQDAQETFSNTVSGATGFVENSITAAKQSLDGIKNGFFGAVQSAQDTFSNTVSSTTKSVSGAGSQVSSQLTAQADSILEPIRGIGRPLKSAIEQASAGVTDTAARVSQEVEGALPPEVREVLVSVKKTAGELSGPLQEVLKEVGKVAGSLVVSAEEAVGFNPNDPAVTALLVGGGTLALVVTWWLREKAGYGGDLTPEEALELLQKERQALLVDIRPQKLRDSYGIPALKRGARFKQASVEFEKLDNSVRKLVGDAAAVEYQILAAKIKGLKNVGSGSTVVVMDDRGAASKDVARAVARAGVKKAYRLDGGYAAWAASQATREDVPEKPVAILKEEAAFIAEDTGVPAPLLATSIASGVVLGSWALWEWEKTLQLIALIGIASSIYSRVQTYQSLDDVKADLRLLQRPVQLGTGAIISLFGLVDKAAGSPQLATSSGGATQASEQRPVVDNEEFDDPVEQEEEEKQEVPVPAAAPVSTGAADQE